MDASFIRQFCYFSVTVVQLPLLLSLFWVHGILISFFCASLCLVNGRSHATFSVHKFPGFNVHIQNDLLKLFFQAS